MPALPVVNKVAKVTVFGSDPNGHNYENVHYYGWTGAAAAQAADMNSLSNYVYGVYSAAWLTVCSSYFSLLGAKAVDLSSPSGAAGLYESTTAGSVDEALLPNVAALLSWQGGPRFRGGHPRTYLPGIPNNYVSTDGTFVTAVTGAGANMINELMTTVPGETYPNITGVYFCWVNYHSGFTAVENPITGRYRNVPKINAVPPVHAITGGTMINKQRTQRRRLRPSPVLL
jgi:hypothetical protein